tara:strand:- start:134595 stop:135980 length:1386 start_codon:yes stop_codon:yes gene_type:complete
MKFPTFLYPGLVLLSLGACGGDDDAPCDFAAQSGCDDGLVCEQVLDGEPACFAPIVLQGQVFELGSADAIEGARIVALDVNGAPVSSVAISSADGAYALPIPSVRSGDEGTPTSLELTLRADAFGYQSFPSGLRQALPIDTRTAEQTESSLVVDSVLTQVGLIPLPAGAGTASIAGTVELPANGGGVLVVAETSEGNAQTAIANRDGEYQIFNVDAGSTTVVAYALDANYQPSTVDIATSTETTVDIALSDASTGTVTGAVQIVNTPGGSMTSVVLAIESTFNEAFGRGQTVPGMRDPAPGIAPNLLGEYSISGVPVGRYVVLAAFENDDLVRDPDISIGGTSTLHIEVTAGGNTEVEGFKVTEALAVQSPGADGPEEVTGTPTFRWEDDSSEDEYVVEVFNAFGEIIWNTSIPGSSGQDPSVVYDGPALESGHYYQFRATSFKGAALSRTEDLKGVFFLP